MSTVKFKVIKPVTIFKNKEWAIGTTGEMDQELFDKFKDSLEEVKTVPISSVIEALKKFNKPENAMAKQPEKETAAEIRTETNA